MFQQENIHKPDILNHHQFIFRRGANKQFFLHCFVILINVKMFQNNDYG